MKQKITTPVVLQMHASECGAACLGIVLGYFGRWVSLAELREKCEVSRDGSNAASIVRAARHYGLECKGLSISGDKLKNLKLPLILFWQFSHFMVLEGFDDHNFYLNDPSTGRRKVSAEEFNKAYSGVALQVTRNENFKPGGEQPSVWDQLGLYLSGSKRMLVGVIVCTLMLTLLAIIVPAILGTFVDDVLGGHESWGGLAGALFGGGILAYILTLFKHRFLKRLAVRMSVIWYSRGMSRLLRLPMEFFQNRLTGDVVDRISSIDRIAKNLTSQYLILLIDMAMSVFFLIAMVAYDVLLSLIVLLLGILHVVLARSLNAIRAVRSQTMRREQGMLINYGMQMLNHAENLRMTGSDDRFFSRWCGQQAKELQACQLYSEASAVSIALPDMIDIFRSAVICTVGGMMVINGEMTLGALVGFFILAQMFLSPVGRFMEFTDMHQALKIDLQRLEDISKTEPAPEFRRRKPDSESIKTFKGRLQLSGHLELRGVTFGYNIARPPVIENFNLEIKPGQRVAIVGPSGSGKSTLAGLVSGIYQPWSGDILFEGFRRDEIPEQVLQQSISMVNQEMVVFSGPLRDNITFWNSAVPDEAVFAAMRDAQLHDEILLRPKGYSTYVEEGGANFSGGQRQRLEIARALVSNPTLLVLDEATSNLDAKTEQRVDAALRRRGVSCLIIAHRLSTVRDSDEIIVLDKGVTVQRGTHSELIEDRDGPYFKLVMSH
ncbi:MAG: cysteine peptidase family C39 domain-containing protein [Acidiferrobacterales bacterium]|nr:cysteine peptidase family C39 domain-containing protein [Acidiferrobacterales bacterium]